MEVRSAQVETVGKLLEEGATVPFIARYRKEATGMTATAGIGTNLYLCKIAMDIEAKHTAADGDGVRIAELDEMSYRQKLWTHRPLTDFWRIGKGYARKLEAHRLYTMGDIALCSLGKENEYYNEDFLYKLFGVNAELLIDHAWGIEPCTMADIKSYRPESSSLASGQVLQSPYSNEKARLVLREMTEAAAFDLTEKDLTTDQLVLTVGYDIENLTDPERRDGCRGEVTVDPYGRRIPKPAHGTTNLERHTASTKRMTEAARAEREKEKNLQKAAVAVRQRFGKNALLKGSSLEEGATARERNRQIGGHKA